MENLSTFAKAWRIKNQASQEICITEHDEDIIINGKIYKSMANEIGAIDINSNLETNRGLFIGVFDDGFINSQSIAAGLWNDAEFEIILFDWVNPQNYRIIWGGIIGNIKLKQHGYEFELLGYEAKLNQNIGRKFSQKCCANLGDENCAISQNSGFKQSGSINFINNKNNLSLYFEIDFSHSEFKNGEIFFISGALKSLKYKINSIDKNGNIYEVALIDNLILMPQIGDLIEIIKPCDKDFETCKTKFQNSHNFYGFPHLPGEGVIYASPK